MDLERHRQRVEVDAGSRQQQRDVYVLRFPTGPEHRADGHSYAGTDNESIARRN
jgi:hypothetical protein